MFIEFLESFGMLKDANAQIGSFSTVGEILAACELEAASTSHAITNWMDHWLEEKKVGMSIQNIMYLNKKIKKVRNALAHQKIQPIEAGELISTLKGNLRDLGLKIFSQLFPSIDFQKLMNSN